MRRRMGSPTHSPLSIRCQRRAGGNQCGSPSWATSRSSMTTTSRSPCRAATSERCWRAWPRARGRWSRPTRSSRRSGNGDRPRNAANAVQTVVSRLRSALGDGVVLTRTPGYVLGVAAGDVDASRFEQLAAEARERMAGGDVEAAGELLRSALALWRGPPLAGCGDADLIRFEAARLEESRLQALEDRFDADLALGRHAEIAADVEAAAAEHRLRERLQEQRLLVLYRCGRPAESLARYRELTRHLREEHGLEPSRRLRDLERRMLTQDADLEVAEPERASAPVPPRTRAAAVPSRRLLTVVFVEAEASGGAGDDERTQKELQRLLHEVGAAMRAHGGVPETVPGDALVASFGIAPAHEDDALRAVRAAATVPAPSPDAIVRLAGVGIATGEAVVSARRGGERPGRRPRAPARPRRRPGRRARRRGDGGAHPRRGGLRRARGRRREGPPAGRAPRRGAGAPPAGRGTVRQPRRRARAAAGGGRGRHDVTQRARRHPRRPARHRQVAPRAPALRRAGRRGADGVRSLPAVRREHERVRAGGHRPRPRRRRPRSGPRAGARRRAAPRADRGAHRDGRRRVGARRPRRGDPVGRAPALRADRASASRW